jgi:thiol-disulfide isomerase/thioredoxin
MRLAKVAAMIVMLAVAGTAQGQRQTLSVGDAAPNLDIDRWVKGEETTLQTGSTYLVQFWATWSNPSRTVIPKLSEFQRKYRDKGLTIIAISSEDLEVVEPWVNGQSSSIDFTVAVDRRNSTKRNWLDAARENDLPTAFLVDNQGKIAYIGKPTAEDFETILHKVVLGRYNPKLVREAAPIIASARSARKLRNWRVARTQYESVIKLDPGVFGDTAYELFKMILVDQNDPDEAYGNYARGKLLGEYYANDAEMLRLLAETIASDPEIPGDLRDLDLALDAAQKARQLNGSDDPPTLQTLALVHYHRGELQSAIDLQKRAYFLAKPKYKQEYRRVLTGYQEAGLRQGIR